MTHSPPDRIETFVLTIVFVGRLYTSTNDSQNLENAVDQENGMKRGYLPRTLLTLFVFMLVPVLGFGQSTGTIRGVVKDLTGAVLPGVTVSATNIATQQKTETISTETGTYNFAFLTPGDYT